MSIKKISKKPQYTRAVMELEIAIHKADLASESEFGEPAQDGWARSVILRDLKHLAGTKPAPLNNETAREKWISQVARTHLGILREQKHNIGIGGLKTCLKAMEESLTVHQAADKRGYLDYLTGFFAQDGFEDHL